MSRFRQKPLTAKKRKENDVTCDYGCGYDFPSQMSLETMPQLEVYFDNIRALVKCISDENEQLKALCLRESLVLKEVLKRKHNKSMIAVVADSLEEQALKKGGE